MSAQSSSHCKSCRSENQRTLNGEIAIHFPWTQRTGQTHSLGFPEASGLFGLLPHGICNSFLVTNW